MNFYQQAAEFRKALIQHALAVTGGKVYAAARELEVQPTYLYRLMKAHGIEKQKNSGAG